MYTIIIVDVIDNETTEVCIVDTIEAVESITDSLISVLPKYLQVDFLETETN